MLVCYTWATVGEGHYGVTFKLIAPEVLQRGSFDASRAIGQRSEETCARDASHEGTTAKTARCVSDRRIRVGQ